MRRVHVFNDLIDNTVASGGRHRVSGVGTFCIADTDIAGMFSQLPNWQAAKEQFAKS